MCSFVGILTAASWCLAVVFYDGAGMRHVPPELLVGCLRIVFSLLQPRLPGVGAHTPRHTQRGRLWRDARWPTGGHRGFLAAGTRGMARGSYPSRLTPARDATLIRRYRMSPRVRGPSLGIWGGTALRRLHTPPSQMFGNGDARKGVPEMGMPGRGCPKGDARKGVPEMGMPRRGCPKGDARRGVPEWRREGWLRPERGPAGINKVSYPAHLRPRAKCLRPRPSPAWHCAAPQRAVAVGDALWGCPSCLAVGMPSGDAHAGPRVATHASAGTSSAWLL